MSLFGAFENDENIEHIQPYKYPIVEVDSERLQLKNRPEVQPQGQSHSPKLTTLRLLGGEAAELISPTVGIANLRLTSPSPSPSSPTTAPTTLPDPESHPSTAVTVVVPDGAAETYPALSEVESRKLELGPGIVKERRRRYLVLNPDYFGPSLELADPLLYDRLIRRFQSSAERETEGRNKGFSRVLEADLRRSEAKLEALSRPNPKAVYSYVRGPNGEILAEEDDEVPPTKEDAYDYWKYEMEMRFVRGEDDDFEYEAVDRDDRYDDWRERERAVEERYFDGEEPTWADMDVDGPLGETGVQDF